MIRSACIWVGVLLGLSYYSSPAWTFRIGGSYEQTPIPNSKRRTPRIPDANRTWTTLGLTWSFSENFGIDLAYAHLFVNDSKINKSGLESEDYTRGPSKETTTPMSISSAAS